MIIGHVKYDTSQIFKYYVDGFLIKRLQKLIKMFVILKVPTGIGYFDPSMSN